MNEPRRLKKYPNRRLYDFERHCYVCLHDVRALIAAHHDVTVIENETSNDITRDTMMQIVMSLEEGGRPLFSQSFLTQLIRCHAADTEGVLGRYLEECMKKFAAATGTEARIARANGAAASDFAESVDSLNHEPVPATGT